MDLITLAAAQAIAKIALDKFVESGAGELGKTLSAALSNKVMQLGNVVWNRIKGNTTAIAVLEGAAQEQPEDMQKLRNYLNALWDKNADFAQDVKKLADELHFELTQIEDNSSMVQINQDNARGWQTKVTGGQPYIGEIHIHGKPPET
jgi:hypothetical protein